MFLLSFKSLKGKLVFLVCAVAAAVALCLIFASGDKKNPNETPSDLRADSSLNFSASTDEERLNFIKQLGYTVREEPDSVGDIVIPEEFDDIYSGYNDLQKKCDLDLSRYKGVCAKKWTYTVTNYPGYEDKDSIKINILVYKGKIIGGDVCCVELDGFMRSFTGE